jgi:enolase
LKSNKDALEIIVDAITMAKYKPGEQCFIALDVAATELLEAEANNYRFHRENMLMSSSELLETYHSWVSNYPIISIEDGFSEYDWASWAKMVKHLGSQIQIVGDDLFTTNPDLIARGIEENVANAVLIKPNQIGTLTETIKATLTGQKSNWGTILSHRSGETEDTSIVDLAIGLKAGQIKTGAPSRGERVAKYNKLLRIEQDLGPSAIYGGFQTYEKYNSAKV